MQCAASRSDAQEDGFTNPVNVYQQGCAAVKQPAKPEKRKVE
jgi:hypothetical protein